MLGVHFKSLEVLDKIPDVVRCHTRQCVLITTESPQMIINECTQFSGIILCSDTSFCLLNQASINQESQRDFELAYESIAFFDVTAQTLTLHLYGEPHPLICCFDEKQDCQMVVRVLREWTEKQMSKSGL